MPVIINSAAIHPFLPSLGTPLAIESARAEHQDIRPLEIAIINLMASDYLALLDYLKVDKVWLVGWSDGGIIGLDIAMKHPERLKGLFAHAANVTVDGLDPKVMENKIFNAYIGRMGEDYQKMSKTPDQFDAFVEQISHMWATQPAWTDAELAKITVPTAIVLGDHDEAITRAHTDHMAQVIPGAQLVILKDVSHFAMLQDPAGYNKAVRDFLPAVEHAELLKKIETQKN